MVGVPTQQLVRDRSGDSGDNLRSKPGRRSPQTDFVAEQMEKSGRTRSGLSVLKRLVEVDVVPRLVLAHRQTVPAARTPDQTNCTPQLAEFARLLLLHDEGPAFRFIEAGLAGHVTVERMIVDLIEPVACHLGDLWMRDVCGFPEVTVGMWRLQRLAHLLSPRFQESAERRMRNHHALLVSMPGEQHTFGLYMVAEFFRRAGWTALSMPVAGADDLISMVRGEWFSLVGISLSCGERLDELGGLIRMVRRRSRNRGIAVMVGGNLFTGDPELATSIGADLTATDSRQAPVTARDYIGSVEASRR